MVGWLKMFVGLARDRFDTLISSPSATLISHIRTLALLIVIFVNDIACIVFFMRNKEKAPLSHISLWLFDTIVAALEAAAIMVKYGKTRSTNPTQHIHYEGSRIAPVGKDCKLHIDGVVHYFETIWLWP